MGEKRIVVTDKTKVYGIAKKKESVASVLIDPNIKDLTVTYGFDKLQNIPGKFLIKVVKKKNEENIQLRDGSWTVVLPLVIKDVHGNKAKLSIWPNHKSFGLIIENNVYYMENIKTGKFPDKKPHGLSSRWGFKFDEAPEAICEKFSLVGYIDGTASGNILGFDNVYRYDACRNCLKKVFGDSSENCKECKAPLVVVPYFHFHVDIAIVIENEEEEIVQFKGFKKMLKDINIEDHKTDEELQEEYFGKNVEITYTTNRNFYGEVMEEKIRESFIIKE